MAETDHESAVMVTGGRGFIGRTVAKLLLRSTYRVVALDQAATGVVQPGLEEIVCDITDPEQLESAFQGKRISGIIHLAAILPTAARRDPLRATRVNLEGSLNMLEMARRFGSPRFVFGSSLSVYGTWPADRMVSESDRAAPEDLYGAAKLYVEQLGGPYRQRYGVEFVSLRIGRVIGAGAASPTSAWRSQMFELLGTSEAAEIVIPYHDFERILLVNVDDIAKMVVTLLQADRPAHAVYNAPCESVVVGDLKRELERLNSNLNVRLADAAVVGNPRLLDCSRFTREFDFQTVPIFDQLRRAAGEDAF